MRRKFHGYLFVDTLQCLLPDACTPSAQIPVSEFQMISNDYNRAKFEAITAASKETKVFWEDFND
jgi:hypothetical protein